MSKQHGFHPSRNGAETPRWTFAEEKTLVDMYYKGYSWDEIAAWLNRSKSACMGKLYQNAGVWKIDPSVRKRNKKRVIE